MTFIEFMTDKIKEERTMIWAVLPWNRCKAALEPNKTPYWGRCERLKKHGGDHALERGFDVVWFKTSIVDLREEWESSIDEVVICKVIVGDILDSNVSHYCIKKLGHESRGDLEHQGKNGMTWTEIKPAVNVTETFLQLMFCPVCKRELINYTLGDGEVHCAEHGKFFVNGNQVVWRK